MADVKHKVERAAFGAAIDGILKYVNTVSYTHLTLPTNSRV